MQREIGRAYGHRRPSAESNGARRRRGGAARGALATLSLTLAFMATAGSAGAATITLASGTAAIATNAPVQQGRLTTTGVASTCTNGKAAPAVNASGTAFPFATVSQSNYDDSPACLTFTLTPQCSPAEGLYSTVYSGNIDVSDPSKYYLGDAGAQSTTPISFSANAPAGRYWEWVIAAGAACSAFAYDVTSSVPVATFAPSVSGTAAVGAQLSADPGTWPGTTGGTFAYHWLRCDPSGSNCGQEAGGYSSTFTPSTADEGSTLKLQVTDTYQGTSATSTSEPTNVVATNPPAPKYNVTTSPGHAIIPGTTLLPDSQGDDLVTDAALPFPVSFNGVTHDHAYASTNGNLQFVDSSSAASTAYINTCLPASAITNMVAPYWDDLDSDTSIDPGLGIFTATLGTAPHRTYVIEWRTASQADSSKRFHFEILLHEDSPTISIVYGAMDVTGDSATVGLQGEQNPAYDVSLGCDVPGTVTPGEQVDFTPSAPSIAGTPQAGQTLTGTDATYVAGIAPVTSQTTWQLCDADGAGCAPTGAGGMLPLTAAMIGHTVRLASTASDAEGSVSSVSDPTAVITAAPTSPGPAPGLGSGTPPDGSPEGGRATTRPQITRLRLAAGSVRTNRSDGLTILASTGGQARVVIARRLPGRRVRGCVAPTRRNRHARRCTRLQTVRTLTVAVTAGRARTVLIAGRGLRPGHYVVTVTVTGAGGRSRPVARTLAVHAGH